MSFAADAKFVAKKGASRYHVPICAIAKNIFPENLINFHSTNEAARNGYSPCSVCLKDEARKSSFIGNKDSNQYHLSTCKTVGKTKAENLIGLANKNAAEKAGYKPCPLCMPSAGKEKK